MTETRIVVLLNSLMGASALNWLPDEYQGAQNGEKEESGVSEIHRRKT
jgi:hypothetical protein